MQFIDHILPEHIEEHAVLCDAGCIDRSLRDIS